jgi:signal transduction histidine kinase
MSFRLRLTTAFLAAALVPVAGFGIVAAALGYLGDDLWLRVILVAAGAAAVVLALGLATSVSEATSRQLRDLASGLDRIASGEAPSMASTSTLAEDALGNLAERQNRLAVDLARRNTQIARVVGSVAHSTPAAGRDAILARAAVDAVSAFDLIDARVVAGDPADVPEDERIPGDPLPIRATIRAGTDTVGVLVARAPATARWERADQELLELYVAIVGSGVQNAELFAQVGAQNRQLVALDAAKDDFLRAVSHNLQTPLARIRAYADQLAHETGDRRPAIVSEQADRLSRMVRQILTVSRLDSGVLRPMPDVLAPLSAVRRAWEALGAEDVPFEIIDGSAGWLAVADPGDVDQILWALLDNAIKYGAGRPVRVEVRVDPAASRLTITVSDQGPGVPEQDRAALFGRFARGRGTGQEGTGLGLYVARSLARANEGDLRLEPGQAAAPGANFSLDLPAESPTEA